MAGSIVLVASCALRMTMGDATFYDVSLTTEARAGNQASSTGIVGAVEADPRIGLSWLDRGLRLEAAYLPRLVLQEPFSGLEVLHRATLSAAWPLQGSWRATALVQGSYGTNDFLTQTPDNLRAAPTQPSQPTTPAPVQAVQPLPELRTVQYVSGDASLEAGGSVGPRLRAIGRISGFIQGGADGPSRAQLPLQRGGRLGGELGWSASAFDVLASSVEITVSDFETGVVDGVALLTETWRHTLRGGTQTRVGAGLTTTVTREAGGSTWTLLPSGEAGVRGQLLRDLEGDLGLRAVAIIDQVTAGVYERADALASLTWQVAPRWTLATSGSGGIVVQGPQGGDMIVAGDLRVTWTPDPAWEFVVGGRGISQTSHGPGTTAISEATVFMAVTIRHGGRL